MKRVIITLVCILFSAAVFQIAPQSARADTLPQFARASSHEAYFYLKDAESSARFIVPYNYCVQVTGERGEWYEVIYAEDVGAYQALSGFCLKTDFTPLDQPPEITYYYKTVRVTYRPDRPDNDMQALQAIVVEAAFYGNFYSGGTIYSYVGYQGSFGYIEGANFEDSQTVFKPSSDGGNTNDSLTPKIVTAVVLTLLVAGALALLLLTSHKRAPLPDGK